MNVTRYVVQMVALLAVMFGVYFAAAPFTSLAPFIAMLLGFVGYNIAGGLVDHWQRGRQWPGQDARARPGRDGRASAHKGQRTGRRMKP